MSENRATIQQVPDCEVTTWYDLGWSYVEPAEVPGYSIIAWESSKPAVQPFPALSSEAVEDAA